MEIIIKDMDDMPRAAAEFMKAIGENKIIALRGKMGAGKTTLVAELMRQLKMDDEASSPTFAIANEYHSSETGETVYHFDFYRLESPAEAYDIGIEDYWDSGNLCLMEWTENIGDILPEETLFVEIEELPDGLRIIRVKGQE
ncbi:MAG: tRNA (adenosine(37)-N6)-threonylcarbamoyltransferase complex ATPase subunit type 1 TsaE [Muribaculaceae bacterium]|nr:tRNA (adenosine(37)-N6)-threonylcarbamoyltransferase complex ATPase subunit type 1 TsaE [Muribaculaceae bacterium]